MQLVNLRQCWQLSGNLIKWPSEEQRCFTIYGLSYCRPHIRLIAVYKGIHRFLKNIKLSIRFEYNLVKCAQHMVDHAIWSITQYHLFYILTYYNVVVRRLHFISKCLSTNTYTCQATGKRVNRGFNCFYFANRLSCKAEHSLWQLLFQDCNIYIYIYMWDIVYSPPWGMFLFTNCYNLSSLWYLVPWMNHFMVVHSYVYGFKWQLVCKFGMMENHSGLVFRLPINNLSLYYWCSCICHSSEIYLLWWILCTVISHRRNADTFFNS